MDTRTNSHIPGQQMAANYWKSTQFNHWIYTKPDLAALIQTSYQNSPIPYQLCAKLFNRYIDLISSVGYKKLQIKLRVVLTATIYFKRFYVKNALHEIDPGLVATTALYLACKIEECQIHIKTVVENFNSMIDDMKIPVTELHPYGLSKVAEMEYYLLEEMDFCLVLFHPSQELAKICDELCPNEKFRESASYVVNDLYRTDLPLLHPPHILAITGVFIACTLNQELISQSQASEFLAGLNVQFSVIIEIAQELFNTYRLWDDPNIPEPKVIFQMLMKRNSLKSDLKRSKPEDDFQTDASSSSGIVKRSRATGSGSPSITGTVTSSSTSSRTHGMVKSSSMYNRLDGVSSSPLTQQQSQQYHHQLAQTLGMSPQALLSMHSQNVQQQQQRALSQNQNPPTPTYQQFLQLRTQQQQPFGQSPQQFSQQSPQVLMNAQAQQQMQMLQMQQLLNQNRNQQLQLQQNQTNLRNMQQLQNLSSNSGTKK